MRSDDAFRRAFEQATAELAMAAAALEDVATVTVERAASYWRLALQPTAPAACPLELVLDPESQTFDIQIGPDTWEGSPIDDVATLTDLVTAVVDGRVVSRKVCTHATGSALATETLVTLLNGDTWRRRRTTPLGERLDVADATTIDRHWAPYRRA